MHIFGIETVELAAYRLKGEAILWYEDWKRARGVGAPPASWEEFKMAFLDHYLPYEIREARADQFLNLRQGNMNVREYSLQFNSLARYAPHMVATMADRVHRYVDRLDPSLVRDCTIAALNKDMDIARIQAFAQKMEDQRERRKMHKVEEGPSKKTRPMGQYMVSQGEFGPRDSTPGTQPQFQGFRDSHIGQSSGMQGSQPMGYQEQGSMNQSGFPRQPCPHCGKLHLKECLFGTNICFWCGMSGHMVRDCPRRGTGIIMQPTGSTIAPSSSVPFLGQDVRPVGHGNGT